MSRKPLGDRALSPADRQRRWRLRYPSASRKRRQVQTASADDFSERQAVVWEYDWLIEELGAILERARFDDKQFVLGHRVGIEQAIELARRRQAEVGALLT